ncbi:hypothetical protein [Dactylosporangium sp. NPDC048998]|uniref:hypothetical protein n=1 Tax=Dactylosporangium sp. NPDC048998 TaxID=3363976 RepID=UPI003723CD8D
MDRIEALLAAVDWWDVEGGWPGGHTGPMADVPEMVRDLWHADFGRRLDAVSFLETAGFEYADIRPATVLLVPVVVAVLADPRSAGVWVYDSWDPELPLRAKLLELLGTAAKAPAWGGTDEELRAKAAAVAAGAEDLPGPDLIAGYEAPERLGVRALAGEMLGDLLPYVDDPEVRVAHAAMFAVTRFAQLLQPEVRGAAADGAAAEQVAAAVQRLLSVAGRGDGVVSVSGAAAYALAELGADTVSLLGHPSLVARACAALSASTAGDARAVAALEEALRYTPDNDRWLHPGSSLQQRLRLHMKFAKVAGARAGSFDELVPGAFVVAAPAAESTEAGWGPLLRVAFPPGWQDRPLTGNQREFLRRLVNDDHNWGERAKYTMPYFAEVGLPQDRDACRMLLVAAGNAGRP